MPTSSIFTSVKLETKEQVESFCDAWDKAEANISKVSESIKGDYLATPKEIKEITKKLLERYDTKE